MFKSSDIYRHSSKIHMPDARVQPPNMRYKTWCSLEIKPCILTLRCSKACDWCNHLWFFQQVAENWRKGGGVGRGFKVLQFGHAAHGSILPLPSAEMKIRVISKLSNPANQIQMVRIWCLSVCSSGHNHSLTSPLPLLPQLKCTLTWFQDASSTSMSGFAQDLADFKTWDPDSNTFLKIDTNDTPRIFGYTDFWRVAPTNKCFGEWVFMCTALGRITWKASTLHW